MPAYLSLLGRVRSLAIVAVACSIGCVVEAPDESSIAAAATVEIGCTDLGCGTNSPVIAGSPFWDLNRDKFIQNAQKFRVVDFRSAAGTRYQIDVRQARLVGLDSSNNVALDTPNIKNARITLIDDRDSKLWELTIIETDLMTYWAPPLGGVTTTYRVQVHPPPGVAPPGQGDYDLCSNPPPASEWPGKPRHMIFHEGDRYDPVQKIVTSIGPATAGWFNVSCAGSVPFKLHLQRHTEPSANPTLPTTKDQRQALMRAYASVVCWGSPSFTVQGEYLNLADSQGVMSPLNPPPTMAKVEGLWDSTHAICRGEHRLVHHDPPLPVSQADADRIWQAIPSACPQVMSCGTFAAQHPGFPTNWKLYGLVLTTNP